MKVFWFGCVLLACSCAAKREVADVSVLSGMRPVESRKPDVGAVGNRLKGVGKSAEAGQKAIRDARRVAQRAVVEADESKAVLVSYKALVDELRATDEEMASRMSAVTADYESLDRRRRATIADLMGRLGDAEFELDVVRDEVDQAESAAAKLVEQVEARDMEVKQQRKSISALERGLGDAQAEARSERGAREEADRKAAGAETYRDIVVAVALFIAMLICVLLAVAYFKRGTIAGRVLSGLR